MKIFSRESLSNGRQHIYFCGIKVFSYKKNKAQKNVCVLENDSRLKVACDIGVDLNELQRKNIQIMHPTGIVIGSKVKLGNNIKIWQNVTIGAKSFENWENQGYPQIGDNCIIYAGAVIIGDIKVGENCIIGANSVVLDDCEPNSIYVGIPAKKIKDYNLNAEQQKKTWLAVEEDGLKEFENSQIVKNLNSESVCIDCGANIGRVSEIMAKTGAKVYAFEPNPLCMEKLEKVCAKYKNIELIKKGVAAQNMKLKLYHNDFVKYDQEVFSQSSSIYASKENVNAANYTEIECVDLCEFIENLGVKVDILKMDIEGAEFEILDKMITKKIYQKVKIILVETHDGSIPELAEKANKVRKLVKDKNINNIKLDWR